MTIIVLAEEHILRQKDGKEKYLTYVSHLSKAFALAVPNETALKIHDDIGLIKIHF